MAPNRRKLFFGETDEPDPAVVTAIKTMSDGRDSRCLAHELISAGLLHLRGNLCDAHVIEELEFVHGWIGEKLAELRRVN